MILLTSSALIKVTVNTLEEYIDKLKFKDYAPFLSLLKASQECFYGELRGFADLPDEKIQRDLYLKPIM